MNFYRNFCLSYFLYMLIQGQQTPAAATHTATTSNVEAVVTASSSNFDE